MSEPSDKTKQNCDVCGCCRGHAMSGKAWLIVAGVVLLVITLAVWSNAASPEPAAATGAATAARTSVSAPATVAGLQPGLASGALQSAAVADLAAPVILKSAALTITQADFDAEIAKAPAAMQPKLKAQPLFLLEQLATRQLLIAEARAAAKAAGQTTGLEDDKALIQAELGKIGKDIAVSDAEAKEFYDANRDMCGAPLPEMQADIKTYLVDQKRQQLVLEHIRGLAVRQQVQVSAAWLKVAAETSRQNPVDRARASGRPSLVDFGSKGCKPCDMLAPILDTLRTKYEGKTNVLFVSVREEQILAGRYGIESIPVQILFDKTGKEVWRHGGFIPQAELEKTMAEKL